jgi:MYXO-CTERM domain-containing protein
MAPLRSLLCAALGTATLTACSPAEDETREEPAAARLAIIGGSESPPSEDSAVYLAVKPRLGPVLSCNGVLVADNLVLTTRSCVTDYNSPYTCLATGEPADDGNSGGYVVDEFPANNILIYVGNRLPNPAEDAPQARAKKIVSDGSLTLCSHDLAAVVLDRPLSSPIAQLRLKDPITVDETVKVVGWGTTETEFLASTRQTREDVTVRRVGPLVADPEAEGTLVPRTFETGQALCLGDFGGPVFGPGGGLVGLGQGVRGLDYSKPDPPGAPCMATTVTSVYMQIAGFQAIIEEAFAAAGAEPWLEGEPDPRLAAFGEACATDTDCQSNLCYVDPESRGATCNLACSDDVPCPGTGLTCGESPRGPVCLDAPEVPDPTGDGDEGGCHLPSGASGSPSAGALALALLGLGVAARRRRGQRTDRSTRRP